MSAELLRRAAHAVLIRVHKPATWAGSQERDLLAALLVAHAEVAESNDERDGFDLAAIDDTYNAAVALARHITREQL